MQTNLVQIDNSKGVRIPTYILKECNINDELEIEVEDNKIILKTIDSPRKNWDSEFKKMHQNGDDMLIIDD